ncbi:uncharacterized protein LDX57_000036 [Aspergillus melleus]|uniref:uncharacterized protein n=1 Tax=Aspergillus melleus TaxID=138277 RepID=UPI001E8E1755|nr:uncharacterized protein LDX57_000036 [Aspergillus melleus]KAH8422278.1 hypothetical protein LDX57_000036 [Aspergillus melleus]
MGRFSPDSWTPAVNVLTWYLLVTAALSVLTRLGTKWWIFRKLTTDDYLSIVSLVYIQPSRRTSPRAPWLTKSR